MRVCYDSTSVNVRDYNGKPNAQNAFTEQNLLHKYGMAARPIRGVGCDLSYLERHLKPSATDVPQLDIAEYLAPAGVF